MQGLPERVLEGVRLAALAARASSQDEMPDFVGSGAVFLWPFLVCLSMSGTSTLPQRCNFYCTACSMQGGTVSLPSGPHLFLDTGAPGLSRDPKAR